MSKSKIIIIVVFTLGVAAAIILALILQQRTVTITSSAPVTVLSGTRNVATIEGTKTLQLRDGEYCAVAIDQKYSKEPQCFMVFKKGKEVNVDVDYSKEELSARLDSEYSAIEEVVRTQYASIINQYTVCRGELLGDGNWYGGVLRDNVGTLADTGNYYYFIMQKEGSWQLKTTPSVVISKHSNETKGIPERIIEKANTLEACEATVSAPENIPQNNSDSFSTVPPLYIY